MAFWLGMALATVGVSLVAVMLTCLVAVLLSLVPSLTTKEIVLFEVFGVLELLV